ncbi:MAG TPA: c-type cytochrome biogenesis protein CcmI, partial [Pseudomonadales bacterium]|nr:c-type cytochrome biogenesis protein CcmI [Pseudomonadales bacterium]
MLELFLVFVIMSVAAVLWVAVPVLRAKATADVERTAVNVQIFQERLKELDADLKEQRISAEEFEQLKVELERTLLADVDANARKNGVGLGGGKAVVVVWLALLIPGLTGVYYLVRGSASETAEWLSLQERMNFLVDKALTGTPPTEDEAKGVTVDDFIRVMQKKLQQDSNNPTGWMLLGVSYLQAEMPNEAQEALQRAYELQPQNMEIQMGYVQAVIAANSGKLTELSSMLLKQILANRPDEPQAL